MTTGIHLKNNEVMKCRLTGTKTKKQLLQWTSKLSAHQKRQDMFTHMWRMCSLFLQGGTIMELCIMNLFHKVKL